MNDPAEVWLQVHYQYRGESYKYNLPLPKGEKYLDGLRIDYNQEKIEGGRRTQIHLEALGSIDFKSLELTGVFPFGDNLKGVFVNGYQSWTGSRERHPAERLPALNAGARMLRLDRFGDASFYKYPERKGCFHGFSHSYIRYPDRVVFVGSLDDSNGYTIIETDIRHGLFSIIKDVEGTKLEGRRLMLDLILLEGREGEVLDRYREMRRNVPLPAARAAGWTSGNRRRRVLDEVLIRRKLASFRERKIPLTYFLIDDGWQSSVGDWDKPSFGFPSGMDSLAAEIKGSGYIPGIWIAPFIVGFDSNIYRNKKEWLVRDSRDRTPSAGSLPLRGGNVYALDLTNNDVRDYLADTFRRIREDWGFGLLKLDFLYAAALQPPSGKNRGEAMSQAMDFLVSLKGDASYLGSGVPLESAFGKVEYCRVSADAAPYWDNRLFRNLRFRERSSTINNLRSTVGRRHLNRLFFANDTDVFMLGGHKNQLETPRRYTLFLLTALLGELLFTSDDIAEYDQDEMRTYLSLFPITEISSLEVAESRRTVTIRYSVRGRSYVSISNLAERNRSFVLPDGLWFGAPGLKRRAHHLKGGNKQNIKPGESRTYLSLESTSPFAGSDGHVFPGCEIESIEQNGMSWTITPRAGVLQDFRVWIRLDVKSPVTINGAAADISASLNGGWFASGQVKIS